MSTPHLQRRLGLILTTFYGLGTIVGAGIYVLVGKVAGKAGILAPFAFFIAALVAALSALSYAEFATRFPKSGGEAVYTDKALGIKPISIVAGLLVVLSGIVSPATLLNGFTGYLKIFVDWPDSIVILGLTLVLGGLAAWGIKESALAITILTLAEIGGLVLVIAVSADKLPQVITKLPTALGELDFAAVPGVLLGSFLAFYAYIGFEDIANIAEEVKKPERNLPLAILISLVASTVLYMTVAFVAVLSLSENELAKTEAPLALLYEKNTGHKAWIISGISLVAVVNGALVQIIMATRMLHGMSREGWIPKIFGKVHARTKTPLIATTAVTLAILACAIAGPLTALAEASSFVVLTLFTLVNFALWRLKIRSPKAAGWRVPMAIPVAGFFLSLALLVFRVRG